jgi:PIN domain nuclease of toxin-antitoxin system
MTVLNTHVCVQWVGGDPALRPTLRRYLDVNEKYGFGVSVISCMEVAWLVNYGKLQLPLPLEKWIDKALHYLHVRLLDLTPRIAVESTQLPGEFHKDPCDRIIVATARQLIWHLATEDQLIRAYPFVKLIDQP